MTSFSKPTYSVKDIIKDPSILTVFAKPGTPPKSFDGLCGNHVGEVLVSTPNMTTLYQPPLNQCSVRMRRDGHFGPDDPLYFPQPFNRATAHLAVIRTPQSSPDHPFAVAWIVPNESHFQPSLHTFCVGFGFLNRVIYSKLVVLSDTILQSIPHGQEDDPYIRSSREHLRRLLDRLCLSAPMDDLFLRFQCAQRHLLELDARIRWITTCRERYSAAPDVDHPGMGDASSIGAFTSDLDVLESLFWCQIPVYFVRILSRAGNARIDKLQPFPTALFNQKFQLHSGFEVDLSDKVPSHRIIFTGLPQNPERYVTMVNYVTSLLDYPSPLGTSEPRSSTSMQKASLPFQPTLPTRSSSRGRYAPYSRGGKSKYPADNSNNTFIAPSSPLMPQSIDNWRMALEGLAGHNQALAAPEGVNRGFALPPADMFVTTGNQSVAVTLFRNYLKLKDIFIYRLSYSSDRYSKKQWRQLLTLDEDQEIRADTRTGKQRLEMQTLLKSMVSKNTVQFDRLSSAPVTWHGQVINGSQVPPTHLAKEIIWELYELNFRQDLVALDAHLDDSNMSLSERQNLLDKCWIGAREYTDCQKAQDGLASTDPTKRSRVLGALHKIMTTWRGTKPPVLLSGFPVDMSGHNFGTRLDQIERELAFYYTSSFLDVFFRAASIPYRLP